MCSIEWLVGRVAVVTGAASGIGLALTEAFLGAGTQVVMADFDGQRLAEQSERLRDGGAGPIDVVTDVSSWGDVEALAGRAVDAFGTVDVLVNNAGTIAFGVAWEIPLEDWERVIGVNLRSMIYGARAFVPHMRASGDDGVIINLASMAAFTTHGSIAPYVTTKHGVVGLSEALSADLHAVRTGGAMMPICS